MFKFIKYLIQLILSPACGWEDIAADSPDPVRLMHRGLLPLLIVAAATEALALPWEQGAGAAVVTIRAFADFGAYFVSVYIARLVFDIYLVRVTGHEPDRQRAQTLAVMSVGLMVLFQIVNNLCPWNLMLLHFLPLYAALVIYKAAPYMGVEPTRDLNFMVMASLATIAAPLAIYKLFFLILP